MDPIITSFEKTLFKRACQIDNQAKQIDRLKATLANQTEQIAEMEELISDQAKQIAILEDNAIKDELTFDYMVAKVDTKSKFIRKCLKQQNALKEQIQQLKDTNEQLLMQMPQVYDYIAIKKRNSKLNKEYLRMVKLFKRLL